MAQRKGVFSSPLLWIGVAVAAYFIFRPKPAAGQSTTPPATTPGTLPPSTIAPGEPMPGGSLSKRDFLLANGVGEDYIDKLTTQEFNDLYTWITQYRNPQLTDQAPQDLVGRVALIGLKYNVRSGTT